MKQWLFLPLFLLAVGTQSIDQHASATVRLNKSFFQLASGKAKSLIDTIVPEIPIPNINVTNDPGLTLLTRWIKLTQFDFPRTTFTISKDGLNWNTQGGKIEIQMEFVVRYRPIAHGPIFSKHGIATVTVEDLRTNLNALIKTVNSRPELITNHCITNVDKMDVVFDADITGILLNLMSGVVLGYVRDLISHKACTLIANLSEQGNKFVRDQPEEIHIWRSIYLNYTAAKDPIFHDDFIEAECSFRVAIHDHKTAVLDLDEEAFAAAVVDSIKRGDIVVSPSLAVTPAYCVGTVLTILRDVLLYALAAYGIFSILTPFLVRLLLMIRRRQPVNPLPKAKVYENEALAAFDR